MAVAVAVACPPRGCTGSPSEVVPSWVPRGPPQHCQEEEEEEEEEEQVLVLEQV